MGVEERSVDGDAGVVEVDAGLAAECVTSPVDGELQ